MQLARILRTQLIPPRFRWVADAVGALVTAPLAYVCLFPCFADWWLWGLIFACFTISFAAQATARLADRVIRQRAFARARDGLCVRCGYVLQHLHSPQCPECGA